MAAVRAVVGKQADWEQMALLVSGEFARHLPLPELLTAEQRIGDPESYRSHVLHTEPNGTFSIVALVWHPGQVTAIHDHVTWCVFGSSRGSSTRNSSRSTRNEDASSRWGPERTAQGK